MRISKLKQNGAFGQVIKFHFTRKTEFFQAVKCNFQAESSSFWDLLPPGSPHFLLCIFFPSKPDMGDKQDF